MIAIVDDDAIIRNAIGRLLTSAGYVNSEYSSGPEFLESLAGLQPSCVVLDLHMPVLSGFDVQEALARSGYDFPVIVITGDNTHENVARATHLGARACLPKPVDADRLIEAIEGKY